MEMKVLPKSQIAQEPKTGKIVLRSKLIGFLQRNTHGMDIKEIQATVDGFMLQNPQIQIVERK